MYQRVDPAIETGMYLMSVMLPDEPVGPSNPSIPVSAPVPPLARIMALVDVAVRNTVSASPSFIVFLGDEAAPENVGKTASVPEMVVGKRDMLIVPELRFDAFKLVKFAPLIAGSVAGNRASGSVSLVMLAALIAPLNEAAVTDPVTITLPPNDPPPVTYAVPDK
jgi:hypothetical protein